MASRRDGAPQVLALLLLVSAALAYVSGRRANALQPEQSLLLLKPTIGGSSLKAL